MKDCEWNLILVEKDMQDHDFFETLQKLEESKQVPYILMAGSGRLKSLAPNVAKNAKKVLVKPFIPTEFITSVFGILREQQVIQVEDLDPHCQIKKVLVVDDDEEFLFVYEKMLSRIWDPEIIKAGSGQEAIQCVEEHQDLDLILMDVCMPGMGGVEATQDIRSIKKNILITAVTELKQDDGQLVEGESDLFDLLIHKPLNIRDLQAIRLIFSATKNRIQK